MKFTPTDLPGVLRLDSRVFRDGRGFFVETFSTAGIRGSGIPDAFAQDNHSRSVYGVLRGLHYQLVRPQGKLVHVARGRIFDVAVDIRRGSPTFARWVGMELSDENLLSLWIPPGFAHGFCVLSDVADVIYKCTTLYDAADDRGIAWDDREIGIEWPVESPLVSEKDSAHPTLSAAGNLLPSF
jgi:dTDP-4-dehydrorhamnose 3,5-epimerase